MIDAVAEIEKVRSILVDRHCEAASQTWVCAAEHGVGSKEHCVAFAEASAHSEAVDLLTRTLELLTDTPPCVLCPNCWPREKKESA